jgi:hypothetical protein
MQVLTQNTCNNQYSDYELEAVQKLCIAINLTSSMIVYGGMSLESAVDELHHLCDGAEIMLQAVSVQRNSGG